MTFKIGPIIIFCIQNPIVIFEIGRNIALLHSKYSTATKYRLFLPKSYFDSQNWAIYHFLTLEIGPIIAFLHSKCYCKIQIWAEYCFFLHFHILLGSKYCLFYSESYPILTFKIGPYIVFYLQNSILTFEIGPNISFTFFDIVIGTKY